MKKISLVCVVLALMIGCSRVGVEHEAISPAKLSGLQSFSWLTSESASTDVRVNNPTVHKHVIAAVEKELEKKGYTQGTKEDADFLVSWFGKVDEKVKEQSIAHFYGSYGYGAVAASMPEKVAEGAVKKTYREGTLIVDIIDPRNGDVIWRGTSSDTLVAGMDEKEVAAYLNASVRRVLAKFPKR